MGRFAATLFGLIVLVCSTACLTVEEQLEHFKEIYVKSQQVLEAQVTRLEAEMIEMKAKVARSEAFERQVNQQASLLNALHTGNRNSGAEVTLADERRTQRDWNSTLNRVTTGPSGIQYPTCCADLYSMGHTLSGVYSVVGSKSIETVFCDFFKAQNQQGFQTFQKWIGYADVKSLPTYFYVQRNSNFNTVGVPIPFQLAKVNTGGAMDLPSGKFTALRKGTYFFSFTGEAWIPPNTTWAQLGVALMLNGVQVGLGHVEGHANWKWQHTPFSIQSTLDMKKGDQVWLQIQLISPDVVLTDSWNQHNHFTGMLLEEDIYQTL